MSEALRHHGLIQSIEFSRPEYWNGWPFPSPGALPNLGIKPRSPTLQADSLPSEPPGKPKYSQGPPELPRIISPFQNLELHLQSPFFFPTEGNIHRFQALECQHLLGGHYSTYGMFALTYVVLPIPILYQVTGPRVTLCNI